MQRLVERDGADVGRYVVAPLGRNIARAEEAGAFARVKGRRPTREAIAVIIGTGEAGQELIEEFEVAERDRPRVDALAQALDKVLLQSGAERNVMLAALAAAGVQTITGPVRRLRKVG